jgi:hypothetical protein
MTRSLSTQPSEHGTVLSANNCLLVMLIPCHFNGSA